MRETLQSMAQDLRRDGHSYGEISQQLRVAKSSVSVWCRTVHLSTAQCQRLRQRGGRASRRGQANHEAALARTAHCRQTARNSIPALTEEMRHWIGLALYWAEGAKSRFVDFANSDPVVAWFMVQWFRETCGVAMSRFRVQLHVHAGQDEPEIRRWWASHLGIPLTQFHKSQVKPEGRGHRKNRLYYGTAKLRICDKKLLHKILGWIEGVKQQVLGR